MKVSDLFDRVLRKVGVRSSSVPVLCHGCGRMIGIPKNQIQFIELDDSPCCSSNISPPPSRMKAGQVWDEFGGERMGFNENPGPDVEPSDMIESVIEMDNRSKR